MWPFKRKKSNTKAVPAEVKKYYASEHRERVGLAWVIAFLSLILTVAVVAGLFFGGRWAYRKIAHKNTTPSTGVGVDNLPAPSANPGTVSKPSNLQPTAPPPKGDGKINTSKPATSSKPKPSVATKSSQPTPTAITNTGAGSTLTVFLAVTILATAGHMQYQRRRFFS